MSILIGADIVINNNNSSCFESYNIENVIDINLLQLLNTSDYKIFNLEVPLTDKITPIEKKGRNYIASPRCSHWLELMGINLLTLANNHIMDQDTQGLFSTIKNLDRVGISHVGAGQNLYSASKPFFFEVKGKKYGVYSCVEHEFSVANELAPGANPFDPLESLDHIIDMKSHCDYAIVLYHGGKEYYPYPSPGLQKTCRKLIQKGANLVVCQHSHCIGCKEEYLNGTIVYGQGDFISSLSNELYSVCLLISLEDNGDIQFIPTKREGGVIKLVVDKEKNEVLDAFKKRSEYIKVEGFIEKQYQKLAYNNISNYFLYFSGKNNNYLFKILNKITRYHLQDLIFRHISKSFKIGLRNYIECEAHRELILKGLEDYEK